MRFYKTIAAALAAAIAASGCSEKTALTKSGLNPDDFAADYKGDATALYTLVNDNGMEVCITNFGGRIVSVMVPDRDGKFLDVVHGFPTVSDYFPENHSSDFGAAIGRYANRINLGRITLDGREIQLPQNNFGHCLHGGPDGWQYKVYKTVEADSKHLKFQMLSPDGDMNFPGTVTAYVTYTLTGDNAIDIKYEASTDATTVINMTNHSYFNLSGDPDKSVTDEILYVNSSRITPIDSTCMTSGEYMDVEGTAFDFRKPKLISQDIDADEIQIRNGNGYDHNWVLDTNCDDTVPAVRLECPQTGIALTVYTNEPGIQVYTGNFLDGTAVGKNGASYKFRSAICLESQKYPDTPNKAQWPSAVLRPGERYYSHQVFAFSVAQ